MVKLVIMPTLNESVILIVSYLCKITDLITMWHFVLNNFKGPVVL